MNMQVVVASGSQFSRLASMLGSGILLNPNYGSFEQHGRRVAWAPAWLQSGMVCTWFVGYIDEDYIRIPTGSTVDYDVVQALKQKLMNAGLISFESSKN